MFPRCLRPSLDSVLKRQTPQELRTLVSNVFVSGGLANLPGICERIQAEVREALSAVEYALPAPAMSATCIPRCAVDAFKFAMHAYIGALPVIGVILPRVRA